MNPLSNQHAWSWRRTRAVALTSVALVLIGGCAGYQAFREGIGLPDEWYFDLNKTYRARQSAAFELLESLDCQFDRQQQGLFVWAKIPERYADGYGLSDELLHEKNVFLTPGGIFGTAGERFVRVSLCSPVEMLREAKTRIALHSNHQIHKSPNPQITIPQQT